MITNAQAAMVVARKELLEHVRTKRLLIVGIAFLGAMVLGVLIGLRLTNDLGQGERSVDDRVSLVLAVFFSLIPFIKATSMTSALGVLLTADAVVGEWRDRTLFLLLSKPVGRSAVLAGKVVAGVVATVGIYAIVFLLGLGVVMAYVGVPTTGALGHILLGAAIVAIGTLPFIGFGVFCSSVFRSTVASFIVAFVVWTIGFQILGNVGVIVRLFQNGLQGELNTNDGLVRFFHHLDPFWLMDQGVGYIVGGRQLGPFGGSGAAVNVPLVVAVMLAHTAVWLGLSFWIVNRRDYA